MLLGESIDQLMITVVNNHNSIVIIVTIMINILIKYKYINIYV